MAHHLVPCITSFNTVIHRTTYQNRGVISEGMEKAARFEPFSIAFGLGSKHAESTKF